MFAIRNRQLWDEMACFNPRQEPMTAQEQQGSRTVVLHAKTTLHRFLVCKRHGLRPVT